MTSLRLLRFAGLMLLLGSVASASAETVKERMKKDPNFRIYPVTFAITATTPPVIRVQQVGTPQNERTKSGHPPNIDIPDAWIQAVKKKIQADPPKPQMKHPSGHFTNIVWKKGVGLAEYAQGYGAEREGFRLKRGTPKNR